MAAKGCVTDTLRHMLVWCAVLRPFTRTCGVACQQDAVLYYSGSALLLHLPCGLVAPGPGLENVVWVETEHAAALLQTRSSISVIHTQLLLLLWDD
jgi:hypothetical protein